MRSALPSFQVLLDPRVLVGKVKAHLSAGTEDPAAVGVLGRAAQPAGEDHGYFIRAADADVVGHERLEEPPSSAGIVERQGGRDLNLAHGQLHQ